MSNRIIQLWTQYQKTLVIILALIMTGTAGYQVGAKHQLAEGKPPSVEIRCPQNSKNVSESTNDPIKEALELRGLVDPENKHEIVPQAPVNCAFIASKTSTKYHLPGCRNAAKISVVVLVLAS